MSESNANPNQLQLVLLVDDDETTNYINRRVLAKADIAGQVDVVTNGEEALDYLKQAGLPGSGRAYRQPDLMFVDIKMSVMDGFEFLDEYQSLPLEMKAGKLIMLSSSASFYDLHRLKQYPDVVQHIAKPLTTSHLAEILDAYFPQVSKPSQD